MDDVSKQQALSAVRTLLAVVGGVLVTKGLVDDTTLQAVIGAVMTLIPLVWGMYNQHMTEKKAQAREAVAVSAGIAQATGGDATPVSVAAAQNIIAAKGPTP